MNGNRRVPAKKIKTQILTFDGARLLIFFYVRTGEGNCVRNQ